MIPSMSADRSHAPEGAIVHLDLLSADPKATRDFLQGAFGWRFTSIPFAGYALFHAPSPPHGGLRERSGEEPPGVRAYVAVDSLAEARDRIVKAGGLLLSDDQQVPGFGRFFLFQEPGGLTLAAFEER